MTGASVTASPAPGAPPEVRPRVLVAGVGNIFLGDDGFGVALADRLAEAGLPAGVQVADYGISGVHLAYELLRGYDATILLDATPRGEPPGTLTVLEVRPEDLPDPSDPDPDPDPDPAGGALVDGHRLQPDQVLALLRVMGGDPGRVLVVGCEPAETDYRIGLSEPVAAAVEEALPMVRELVARQLAELGEESEA
jgi:hydrogenase maturation protease